MTEPYPSGRRIAYGVGITPSRLARVERAEAAARRLLAGHHVHNLRVRDLGETVRLEVDAHLVAAAQSDPAVHAAIGQAGFASAPLVVEAFRSGAMNEMLPDPERWRRA